MLLCTALYALCHEKCGRAHVDWYIVNDFKPIKRILDGYAYNHRTRVIIAIVFLRRLPYSLLQLSYLCFQTFWISEGINKSSPSLFHHGDYLKLEQSRHCLSHNSLALSLAGSFSCLFFHYQSLSFSVSFSISLHCLFSSSLSLFLSLIPSLPHHGLPFSLPPPFSPSP